MTPVSQRVVESNGTKLADRMMQVPRRPKVIGVGLHKTGTTSLASALYTLGYYVGGYFDTGGFATASALEDHVVEQAGVFDAVQDMPWPAFYQLLDERFPGSRFVLTVRDPDRWVNSVVHHFGDRRISSHEMMYGVPTASDHEQRYLECFRRHNEQVQEYFAGRDDLLVMDLAAGDGWSELCAFLGAPEPAVPFPRQNEAAALRRGRYRRAVERRVRARVGRIPALSSTVCPVGAIEAYASVQLLCQRFDLLADALDGAPRSDDIARAEGMMRTFLEHHLCWARTVCSDASLDLVDVAIDAWDLPAAWWRLAELTRRWTSDLTDYGTGLRAVDGSKATSPVRWCVNDGFAHWNAIATAFDFEDVDPNPQRPLAVL